MASSVSSLPLYERICRKNTKPRAVELIILFLLISLLIYRLLNRENHGVSWLMAFFCELFFTFVWILTVTTKWNQVDFITHPERLLQWASELPPVDMFVTTADAAVEPPIITVNTVLSLLALDYPADKLACYVSDDGASPLTFYALIEASKFAKLWVPFCKKYKVQIRAPFRYFPRKTESSLGVDTSLEFQQEWKKMKGAYEQLSQKIEDAARRSFPCDLTGEFAVFSNIERTNHQTIIKVIWENEDVGPNGLPHLVYISREKRPKHPHHFKAGAMNVLTRVSGVMTNAPFILNVDCDMYVNNSQIALHAMCLLLGVENKRDCAFVQSPQCFYDGPKDDPFGNQLVVLQEYIVSGASGIQGPFYCGTGCFHRRKVIYGLSPDEKQINGKLSDEYLGKRFGNLKIFNKAAAQILLGWNGKSYSQLDLSTSMEAACKVASCVYEHGTSWGTQVGWLYGSTAEDMLTGLAIHRKGWRSAYCNPDPDAFLGCVPSTGPTSMIQQKRWATGLLEILISPRSPLIATLTGKLQLKQCIAYMCIQVWALRSIPELCYAALPAFSILTNSRFLPKVQESAILIPVSIFVIFNLYTLSEYLRIGLSIRAWWNNQRMWTVIAMTAWLFGMLSVMLKHLGLSETVFEVTQKEQTSSGDDDDNVDANAGRYTFNESWIFIPGTTVLLVHLMALATGLLGFRRVHNDGNGCGIGEFIGSMYVVLCFWPYLKGLFGKGKYGIPLSTIYKSGALALLFVQFCKWTSMG
ncbi:cellulose synthase-like protein H1 isoform X1 [Cornus florida]|uniref:cellulose synthase-like protein H1 isoform X1 n=1 Tax=Cornus florida TaxID=4283 RepID=UPI00289D7CE7|nr:cellulose synthase-like protein H1 isoform X1 [Cornus florida]